MARLKGIGLWLIFTFILSLLFTSASYGEEKTFSQEDRERLIRLETTLKEFKESVEKRFEQFDKRLEFIQNLLMAMFGVFGGLCGVFVGLLLWDRKTFKEKAREEAMKEIEKKYRIGDWIDALREYSRTRQDLAEILRKLNLL